MRAMSVLARPQWFVRSPPRLQAAELSPLSAASAGSPSGGEGDAEGGCGGYGGSLIMVQHECSADTERAAEAESGIDEERLCSVVLDPLPTALLQSLGARGHVRMRRPPAAATSWPPSPPPLPQTNIEDQQDDVRELVHDLVSVVEKSDADATMWKPEQASGVALPSSPINELHRHHKKHRKARRESHDSEGRRKRRKRSTSSSSGSYCTTPVPRSEVEASAPRVNPIFVWVTQSEESTITQVLCEDYDKRNRIRLTKTPQGWRAIPRTERLAVLQPTAPQDDTARSPSPEVTLDLSTGHNSPTPQYADEHELMFTPDELHETHEERHVTATELEVFEELGLRFEQEDEPLLCESEKIEEAPSEKFDLEDLLPESLMKVDEETDVKLDQAEDLCKPVEEIERIEDQIEQVEAAEEPANEELKSTDDVTKSCITFEDELKIEPETMEEEVDEEKLIPKKNESEGAVTCMESAAKVPSDDEKVPPPAHASSLVTKKETLEPAADLSANKRRRRLSGLLPCRSPLRLPPLQARPLPSPVALSTTERRTPSPAHKQLPLSRPLSNSSAVCGSQVPSPAHQHERHSPFLENLLSHQPLSLEAKRPSSCHDPPAKRRRSDDITLRTLLGGPGQSVADVDEAAAPRSRLLELLTTASPTRKPVEAKRKPSTSSPPASESPPDALTQLRQVLKECHVPDPLLVPTSRFAAVLSSPATEIPRLIRSPPPSNQADTMVVSLSRLQALLRRSDSELLAWAQEANPTPIPVAPMKAPPLTKVKSPPAVVIPKVPVTKPPTKTLKSPKPSIPSSGLPWSLPPQKSSVPPPATADLLAAFHAMYGSVLQTPSYFAPPFPTPHDLGSLWPSLMLSEMPKPPSLHQPPPTPPSSKPRIACKSLLELLATKPRPGTPAVTQKEKRAPQQAPPPQQQQQTPTQTRDAGCPRLWHPLFGSKRELFHSLLATSMTPPVRRAIHGIGGRWPSMVTDRRPLTPGPLNTPLCKTRGGTPTSSSTPYRCAPTTTTTSGLITSSTLEDNTLHLVIPAAACQAPYISDASIAIKVAGAGSRTSSKY
ncbi:hypothetical protein B566_EDAN010352 [Ephemera danica]|nr:hypothetical protein B566_EDAN010352 [Ephemera danica]